MISSCGHHSDPTFHDRLAWNSWITVCFAHWLLKRSRANMELGRTTPGRWGWKVKMKRRTPSDAETEPIAWNFMFFCVWSSMYVSWLCLAGFLSKKRLLDLLFRLPPTHPLFLSLLLPLFFCFLRSPPCSHHSILSRGCKVSYDTPIVSRSSNTLF